MKEEKNVIVYYIDSAVILELFTKKSTHKRECVRFLYKLRKDTNIQGKISIFGLGEILNVLLNYEKVRGNVGETSEEFLNEILKPSEIEICSFKIETFEIISELINREYILDKRDEIADLFHLAIAITNNCKIFVTLREKNLLKNNKLVEFIKEKYGLKIISVS